MKRCLEALTVAATLCWGCAGASTLPEPPPAPTEGEAPPPEPEQKPAAASLTITSSPETEVLLDGKPVGKTPVTLHDLEPGPHDVTYVDEEAGNSTLPADLVPGQMNNIHYNLPQTILRKENPTGKKR
ncbi:MAG: PEGA domain-containing protein [Deltaproteobacteria bacterium]|nr:PEGA domain-containing protein [Deltaproteobacteria bacterium]